MKGARQGGTVAPLLGPGKVTSRPISAVSTVSVVGRGLSGVSEKNPLIRRALGTDLQGCHANLVGGQGT